MSLVSERYAESYFEAAAAAGKQDVCLQDIMDLKDIFEKEPAFVKFLLNPRTLQKEKQAVIRDVFTDNADPLTVNLLLLLLEKGRVPEVPAIAEDYKVCYDRQKNILSMTITTAFEAEPELISDIAEKFRKQYKADSVQVETTIDPDIIGGAVIVIGDTMYDESVRGKLKALQAEINAE